MIWHAGVFVAALLATAAGALPSSAGANDFAPVGRPNIIPWPHGCGKPHHPSPPRDRHCNVVPRGQGQDDAPGILQAFRSCNSGGTVVLDKSYTIGTPLDLTFLKHVDVVISGTINFTTDLDFWVENAFKYAFQTTSTFWRFGGEDVNIYGGGKGTINGNGQPWWDANVVNATILRPIMMVVDGLNGGTISGINMINPPNWFNLIANSSNIIVSNMNLGVHQTSTGPAHNTDGWDTFRSDSIVIQDSVINNTDDCVSFKPNSTNMVVQNLHCNGSHGISVGSLGQYIGVVDIVQDIYVYNISMANASDGARIKVWPGIQSIAEPNLSGGGGTGFVKNMYCSLKHVSIPVS
jgi:galacturan 1,4-alpha-galacturonidase